MVIGDAAMSNLEMSAGENLLAKHSTITVRIICTSTFRQRPFPSAIHVKRMLTNTQWLLGNAALHKFTDPEVSRKTLQKNRPTVCMMQPEDCAKPSTKSDSGVRVIC